MFKYRRWRLAIALFASLATTILPLAAIAQTIPSRWAAKRYKVPALGSPVRREAAATRGNCPADPLIALTPMDGMAVTTTAYPKFFFRVPGLPANSSLPVKFTLQDGNQTVYQTNFPLRGNRRTISVSLPSTGQLAPLAIDRNYRWLLTIECSNDDEEPANLITTGIIRRIVPDAALIAKLRPFSSPLSTTTYPLALPAIYAEAEIWQDALMQLADLRRSQPQNPQVTAQWQSLLKSVDLLDTVITDPLSP